MTENRYNQQNNYLPAVAKARQSPVVRIEGAHVQRIAESALNIPYSTISHNLLKTHRSRNFEWSYVND